MRHTNIKCTFGNEFEVDSYLLTFYQPFGLYQTLFENIFHLVFARKGTKNNKIDFEMLENHKEYQKTFCSVPLRCRAVKVAFLVIKFDDETFNHLQLEHFFMAIIKII